MNSFIEYFIEANMVFIILFAIYQVFFRKLTFYRTNRVILLSILPLSFILPFLNFEIGITYSSNIAMKEFAESQILAAKEVINSVAVSNNISLVSIGFILYTVVCMFFVWRLVLHSFKILQVKRKSHQQYIDGVYTVEADVPTVFSVFKWVFYPKNSELAKDSTILLHEKLHAQKFHTIDLILTEIVVALFWLNPFVYLFRMTIRTIHELQVDAILLQDGTKKSHYLQLLLNNMESQSYSMGILNYFNGITIKKRVQMITKNKSSKIQTIRYLLLIPALALLTMSFTSFKGEKPSLFPIKKADNYRITQKYGVTYKNPITKKFVTHKGIDIAAKLGVDILATAGGKVVKISETEGYGKLIVIDHGSNIQSWYAHLKDFNVKEGQSVRKGQVIAHVGNTGYSTGPHLHFEIRKNENKKLHGSLHKVVDDYFSITCKKKVLKLTLNEKIHTKTN
jgi:beta-lactamase regulating signal transducer with metallopeptidase domain